MLSFDINWWAVIVAALIYMVLGSLWYSKLMFGPSWARASGRKIEDMSGANSGYAAMIIAALLQAFLLANLIRDIGITTGKNGLLLGIILWAGFVAATSLGDHLFGGRPWKLWQLNTSYYLVVLLINGWLLTVWQ